MTARRFDPVRPLFCLLVLGGGALMACPKREQSTERPSGLPASSVSTPTAPPGSPTGEAETVPAAPDPKTTISGTITVPPARRKAIASTDILFIIARRAGSPPGPGSMIAVQKHPVGQFPMPFTLGSRDSMLPGARFQGKIDITVRVDKDGDGLTRRKGDLLGQANNIPVGTQDLAVSVDTIQTEDQTLAGVPADSRGRPPAVHP